MSFTKTVPNLPDNLQRALALHDPPLTQRALSNLTGIAPSEVSRIVNRGMRPTRKQAIAIARVLA